jgi:hypothetical protein
MPSHKQRRGVVLYGVAARRLARTGWGMAHQRGGQSRRRCRRDGLFVDGVKVPTGPGGAVVVFRDGDRVRRVDPASLARLMRSRSAPLDVLVLPEGGDALPAWFDEIPPGLAVWRGRVHPDAGQARSRRRVRNISFWDDRNLLSCVNFISTHPDPAVPEQQLLAVAALACAEAGQVPFVRRRRNLEALVRAGERSQLVRQDLAVVRALQHGTDEYPLTPTGQRRVLRRRATRLLHRSEAAAARLQSVAALDRCGAALAVASRVAAVDADAAARAALTLAVGASAVQTVHLVTGPQVGLWAYRALATLSVFARANARTLDRADAEGARLRAQAREDGWRRDHELFARSAPETLVSDAVASGVEYALAVDGTPVRRVSQGASVAGQQLADSVVVAASATVELASTHRLRSLVANLVGSVAVVTAHAQLAQTVAAAQGALSASGVELASAALLGVSAAAVGRSRHPGAKLARQARATRKDHARARRNRLRQQQREALSLLRPPSVVSVSPWQVRVGVPPVGGAASTGVPQEEVGVGR